MIALPLGLGDLSAAHPLGAILVFVSVRAMCVAYPPAPGLPADLFAVVLFGPTLGFALAELGIMLGASMAFGIGRRARDFVLGSSPRSRLSLLADRIQRSIDDEDETQQFCWWFNVRLLTNPLFDPLSYSAGLTHTRFRPFFLGTLLGNIPSIGLFFLAEHYAIANGALSTAAVTAGFGLIIWTIASRWLIQDESPVRA
jgi:uncharacterized membrane protein YdjX (TVP38/TMEM64 family)